MGDKSILEQKLVKRILLLVTNNFGLSVNILYLPLIKDKAYLEVKPFLHESTDTRKA